MSVTVKLNDARRKVLNIPRAIRPMSGETMDAETTRLVQAWILRFCEAPAVIDKELMRAVLAEEAHDTEPSE